MAISINQLVKEACELTSLVAPGESVDGNMATVAVNQLNRAIARLNSQDYIAGAILTADVNGSVFHFRKLVEGEARTPSVIDSEPPEKLTGVSRRIGGRWLPLHSEEPVTLYAKTRLSLASSYCYDVSEESAPDGTTRLAGKVTLDGLAPEGCRVFYNSKIPEYRLTDKCYLSELYHDMLVNALCVGLCDLYKLVSYRDTFEERLAESKRLVKRDRIAGRMLSVGNRLGGYMDRYLDGRSGEGF